MSLFYLEGGWGMYPTTLFGFFLVVVGALFTFRAGDSKLRPVLRTLTLMVLLSGLLGTTVGITGTLRGAAETTDGTGTAILLLGVKESLHNLVLAMIFITLTLVITVFGDVRAARSDAPKARES
jgi:hypothetical protein